MLIGILLFAGLSVTILIHEAGHFFVAKFFGLKVEEFGFGFPPRIFAKKYGETEYSLNWLPFGGFVKILGEDREEPGADSRRSFASQGKIARAAVVGAGVAMNFLLGWFLISLIYMIGTSQAVVISEVRPDSPAAQAGIAQGDVILGFSTTGEFINYVNAHRGEEISFEVMRDKETQEIRAIPRANPKPGEGALGIGLVDAGTPRKGFFSSIYEGFFTALSLMWFVVLSLYSLFKGLVLGGVGFGAVMGPVGIFGVASQVGQLGLLYVVQLVALISLNLAVMNVLPLPALDGGRLFFLLLEKLSGRPLPRRFERGANAIGFMVLLLLMIAITAQDIGRLL